MILLLTFVAIVAIAASMWFLGLWNCIINMVNVILAALIASNWFEPLATTFDGGTSTYTYMLDFICVWSLFVGSFTVLRIVTDFLSRMRVEFDPLVDYGMRTVVCLFTAWVFVCFMQFTMHLAPVPPDSFQANPETVNFPGSPDRQWLGFLQGRSRGSLAAALNEPLSGNYNQLRLHERDANLNARVFDPRGEFIYKYRDRRWKLSREATLRVLR